MPRSSLITSITDWPTSLGIWRPIAFAAILAPGLAACDREAEIPNQAEPAPRPVRVAEAQARSEPDVLRLPGAMRARQRARLAFIQAGYLAERPADPGEPADRGQTLATLYNPALHPGVAAAEADLNETRERLQQLEEDTRRQAELFQRELIAEDVLDQTRTRRDAARATLQRAEAELQRARAQLDDAALRAPFAGRVTRVFAEPGEFVRAGEPVLALANDGALEAEVQVPPQIASALEPGAPATLHLTDTGRERRARIAEIGRAEPRQPVPVVVQPVGDEPLDAAAGAPVYVQIQVNTGAAVTVPLGAVVDPGSGNARVFRVVDGRAEQLAVAPGRLADGWLAVDGQVAAGDRIVVAGQAHLLDGEPVRVLP